MIDFSVIVLTYNADYRQIRMTLDSIVRQQNIEYEIIVCDDCSRENYFAEIEQELEAWGIEAQRYHLLGSEQNQGTVKNILKGLYAASGKYAKLIGAGDMLYHRNTLRDIYDFMEENDAECCFGMMRGYRRKEGRLEFVMHDSPRDILAYRRQDEQKIAKNLLVCEDWVSGAGIFARTDYYKKYISMIEGKVLYCEDWASALAVVDHVFLKLYDQYVIWYEVGDGISTSSNAGFRQKLLEDNRQFWKVFESYCASENSVEYAGYIRKRRRKKKLEHLTNEKLKLLYKAVVNPDMLLYEMDVRKQKQRGMHLPSVQTEGFLDDQEFAYVQEGESYAGS